MISTFEKINLNKLCGDDLFSFLMSTNLAQELNTFNKYHKELECI